LESQETTEHPLAFKRRKGRSASISEIGRRAGRKHAVRVPVSPGTTTTGNRRFRPNIRADTPPRFVEINLGRLRKNLSGGLEIDGGLFLAPRASGRNEV
jgi:hypothetical protein